MWLRFLSYKTCWFPYFFLYRLTACYSAHIFFEKKNPLVHDQELNPRQRSEVGITTSAYHRHHNSLELHWTQAFSIECRDSSRAASIHRHKIDRPIISRLAVGFHLFSSRLWLDRHYSSSSISSKLLTNLLPTFRKTVAMFACYQSQSIKMFYQNADCLLSVVSKQSCKRRPNSRNTALLLGNIR